VVRINVVLARTAVPALLLSATSFVPASAHVLPLRSVTLEVDALAYAVNVYSGVLAASLANGLSIALGVGHYEVPSLDTQRMPGADPLNDDAEMAGVHLLIRYAREAGAHGSSDSRNPALAVGTIPVRSNA
jgi:hypothetical protein